MSSSAELPSSLAQGPADPLPDWAAIFVSPGARCRTLANCDLQADANQVVLIMVGLPARGKSLISGKGMYKLWYCLQRSS